ncbi:LpqB family beta-propeller domain-containing protein [Kitasatospora arboriphila]
MLAATPHRDQTVAAAETTTITVSGSKVAELDEDHSYRVVTDEAYRQQFTFVKETEGPDKGEWRIDRLPDGLIVDQTNFRNSYRAVHRYFYVSSDPSADGATPPVMVPDPIYLRRRTDPLTAAAKALAAPLAVARPGRLLGLRGRAHRGRGVRQRQPGRRGAGRRRRLRRPAEHLQADGHPALPHPRRPAGQGPAGPGRPVRRQGRLLGDGRRGRRLRPRPSGSSAGASPYYQLDTGQVLLLQGDGPGWPVAGPLGQAAQQGQPRIGEVAVRRDGSGAAAIGADGRSLFVTGFGDGDQLGGAVVSSRGIQPGQGLASPSWDGRQNLWVVDRDPAAPQLYMVRGRKSVAAQVDGLADRTVQDARISSDGTRIALVLKDGASGARCRSAWWCTRARPARRGCGSPGCGRSRRC